MAQKKSIKPGGNDLALQGKRLILITLLLSMTIHLGAITAFRDIFPLSWFSKRPKMYQVDLIRPPVKDIEKADTQEPPPVSQIHHKPLLEPKEATISLDTDDANYTPYTKVLKERIYRNWVYPPSARENLIQGSLVIAFRLNRNGTLVACKIVQSSEHEILDAFALRAIKCANPFPQFPETITVHFLNINATFAYRLEFEK
jgi:TonB family protein